jgi:NAD(P)-dependent dehydrogenase (short-subunit alcohol dehydrogenase family)
VRISLEGERAIVAGGAGAIGLAISKALAAAGADVTVFDVALEALDSEPQLRGMRVDLTDVEQLREAVDEVGREGLHIVVHVAGANLHKPLKDVTEADWDLVDGVNLKSCFFLAQAALPHMRRSGGGSIIFTSSCSAKLGYPGLSDYCATKGGVEAMVRSLACDAAPEVRVNAIAPGTTRTPMTRGLWEDERKHRAHAATIPLGRLGNVEDHANACLFLASDLSSYVTGAVLPVDGGLTAMQQDFIDLRLREGR